MGRKRWLRRDIKPTYRFGHDIYATVNTSDQPSPWPYTPKQGATGIFPKGAFLKAALTLRDLVLA